MPIAEIIAIGTELLLGEIQDTNTTWLARRFRDAGIDLYRTTTIGDNAARIAAVIQEAAVRSDMIITTGGLGPTVDDPTREAVSLAAGVEPVFSPILWEQIQNRFARFNRQATENNRRQAYIPTGATAIENPVGTAPAFRTEIGSCVVISLPGVPREMEHLFEYTVLPYLRERFNLQSTIKAYVLHAAGIGESQVDEWIGDLERLSNPTVGLAAHAGQIDIRITAKAASEEEAELLIKPVADEIRRLVGDAIYGAEEDTLEEIVLHQLQLKGWTLGIAECGLNGDIAQRIAACKSDGQHTLVVNEFCDYALLENRVNQLAIENRVQVALGASLVHGAEKQTLTLVLHTPLGEYHTIRSYGGPPAMGPGWAVNTALDFLRRNLLY